MLYSPPLGRVMFSAMVVPPVFCFRIHHSTRLPKKQETPHLPDDLDYTKIKGLRIEAQQKLNTVKPLTLGQASRISGVSPADIAVLTVYLKTVK